MKTLKILFLTLSLLLCGCNTNRVEKYDNCIYEVDDTNGALVVSYYEKLEDDSTSEKSWTLTSSNSMLVYLNRTFNDPFNRLYVRITGDDYKYTFVIYVYNLK